MNNIESWERECLTKKRYDSNFVAEKVAAIRGKEASIKLYTYRCQDCGYWHLTKQEQAHNRFKILKVVR